MPESPVRLLPATRLLCGFLLLLAAMLPAAARADQVTDTASPQVPVDRFSGRQDLWEGTFATVLQPFAPTATAAQAPITPFQMRHVAENTDKENGPQLNPKYTATNIGSPAATPTVDRRVRLDAAAGNLTLEPGTTLPDLYDGTLTAAGCDGPGDTISLCLSWRGPTGTDADVTLDAVSIKPGTPLDLAFASVDADGVPSVVLAYVDAASSRPVVQLIDVQPGNRTTNTAPGNAPQFVLRGTPIFIDDNTVAPAALRVVTGDFRGTGRTEVLTLVDRPGSGAADWHYTYLSTSPGGLTPVTDRAVSSTSIRTPTLITSQVRDWTLGDERTSFTAVVAVAEAPSNDGRLDASQLVLRGTTPNAEPPLSFDGTIGLGAELSAIGVNAAEIDDVGDNGATDAYLTTLMLGDSSSWRLAVVQVARTGTTGRVALSISANQAVTDVTLRPEPTSNALSAGMSIAAVDARAARADDGTCKPGPGLCQDVLPTAGDPTSAAKFLLVAARAESGADRVFYTLWKLGAGGLTLQSSPDNFSNTTVTLPGNDDRGAPLLLVSGAYKGRTVVGEPTVHSYRTQEPLVVVNAPPTHLDVVDGTTYDLNTCKFQDFVAGDCEFFSQYSTNQSVGQEISAQVTEDWDIGGSVATEVGISVATIKASVGGSRAAQSIDGQTQATTTSVSLNAKAQDDDQIYVLNKQYNALEYPFRAAGAKESGHALVVQPHVLSKRWVSANGSSAETFVPRHQPGNVLSYPSDSTSAYVDDRPEEIDQAGDPQFGTFGSTEFEISRTSDFTYTVNRSTTDTAVKSGTVTNSFNWSVGFGVNVEGGVASFTLDAELNGNYSKAKLNTQTTTLGNTLAMQAKLGRITGAYGRTEYFVKPFLYLSEPSPEAPNSALVLDYAVQPARASDGVGTFWDNVYGERPDLAFNLPHYFDPQRGIAIASQAERRQSRAVTVDAGTCASPQAPEGAYPQPGDSVCLQAQVDNYSLVDVPSSRNVKVSFYLGDPAYGGTLIGSDTLTNGVAARGTQAERAGQVARVTWAPPGDVAGQTARIFAVIDPEREIDELRHENNKAWAPLYVWNPQSGGVARAIPKVRADLDAASNTAEVRFTVPTANAATGSTTYEIYAYEIDEDGRAKPQAPKEDWDPVALGSVPAQQPGAAVRRTVSLAPLTAGREYVVTVYARLASGDATTVSTPSEPIGRALGVPTPPRNVTGAPGDERATVEWEAPVNPGASPVQRYVVRVYGGGATDANKGPVKQTVTTDGVALVQSIESLANGVPVKFTVSAVNDRGESAESELSGPVTPMGSEPPASPTGVDAEPGDREVRVTWQAPANAGSEPISGYTVRSAPSGFTATVGAGATSATVTGLTNGRAYTFTVTANSAVGSSERSEASPAVTPRTVPGAPQSVVAIAGVQSATISWTPGASDGGAPVSYWLVRAAPGDRFVVVGGASFSTTMPELTAGTEYRFTVTAVNVAGSSAPSAESAATTPLAPGSTGGGAGGTGGTGGAGGTGGTGGTGGSGSGGAGTGSGGTGSTGGTGGTGSAGTGSGSAGTGSTVITVPQTTTVPGTTPQVTQKEGGIVVTAPGASLPVSAPTGSKCSIDGGPAVDCRDAVTTSDKLTEGFHTLTVETPGQPTRTERFLVDTTAPRVALDPIVRYTRLEILRPLLSAADDGAGVGRIQVRVRRATRLGAFGRWRQSDLPAGTRRAELTMARGTTACIALRAVDAVGNVSAWTKARCTTRALDDRDLRPSGRRVTRRASATYNGSVTVLQPGTSLITQIGTSQRLVVLPRDASPGARLEVRVGSKRVAVLSSALLRRASVSVPLGAKGRSGRVVLKAVGGRVGIDGLAIIRE